MSLTSFVTGLVEFEIVSLKSRFENSPSLITPSRLSPSRASKYPQGIDIAFKVFPQFRLYLFFAFRK